MEASGYSPVFSWVISCREGDASLPPRFPHLTWVWLSVDWIRSHAHMWTNHWSQDNAIFWWSRPESHVDGEWGGRGAPVENQQIVTKIREQEAWTSQWEQLSTTVISRLCLDHQLKKSTGFSFKIMHRLILMKGIPVGSLIYWSQGLESWDFKVTLRISNFQPGRTYHTGWGWGEGNWILLRRGFDVVWKCILNIITSTCLLNKNQSLIFGKPQQEKEDNIVLASGNGLNQYLASMY